MKKLFVASHTGFDGIERWLVVRAVDMADKEQSAKVKADIKAALSYRVPEEPEYNKDRDVNYGPYTDEFEVSEAAYREILRKFPDGDILPREKWFTVLDDMGITNEWASHYLTLEGEEEPQRLRMSRIARISTLKKAAAARINGAKGGRPPKK
jgi:hypothetical protein